MISRVREIARRILGMSITVRVDRELMLRYAARVVDPSGVFVDIGAGTGETAREFVERTGMSPARSFLLEPDPTNYAILARKYPNYRNFQLAIAEKSGMVSLYSMDDPKWEGSSKSNTLYREVLAEKYPDRAIVEHRIEALTMDDFCRRERIEKIEFIFFNCEGAEYEIFSQGANWLRSSRMVWIDFHGHSRELLGRFAGRRRDMYELFESYGFTRVGGNRKDDIETVKGHLNFLWERLDWQA